MTEGPSAASARPPYESTPPRPAATVMLLRDTDSGVAVFLLERAATMAFAAGMTVFPGGGVDDRDRNADIDWVGPEPAWWARRMGVDEELALALVCAAVRETFEECGVLLAGPAEDLIVGDASLYHSVRADLAGKVLSFSEFLRREQLVLRADLLRPWANWVTPPVEPRRFDTYFFVAALPEGQHADGQTTEAVDAGWCLPADATADFAAGRRFLLPPTWTQLNSLSDARHTVGDILATEREIVSISPEVIGTDGNWSIDFFDAERYKQALRQRRRK